MARGDYNWLIGAGLGFVMGGPIGAILGGILGSQAHKLTGRATGSNGREGDLIVSFIVLAAAITKADNEVKSSEVQTLKKFLIHNFGQEKAAELLKLFKELLTQHIDVEQVCFQISSNSDGPFHRLVVQVLFEIAVADGELSQSEEALLIRIAQWIGLSEFEYKSIASQYNSHAPERDFAVLEISPSASIDEIKARFRELVKKYHPDKTGHLGAEFRSISEKKFKEINDAYQRIRDKKGF